MINTGNHYSVSRAEIPLAEGEKLRCEPGSMLAYRNLSVETARSSKSYLELTKSYFLGGESIFANSFEGQKGGGWIRLEEQIPGQIVCHELRAGEPGVVVTRESLLASTLNVSTETKYRGVSGFFKGVGIGSTVAKLVDDTDSVGRIYLNSGKGVVQAISVSSEDGPVVVDNDHIVGYTEGLENTVRRMGNTKSLFLSGEGFVCEFAGNGTVFVDSGTTGRSNALSSGAGASKDSVENTAIQVAVAGAVALGVGLVFGREGVDTLIKIISQKA